MKKFILSAFLMLTISLTAQVQTINSQLRLNNVQPGAPSDSVLVRSSNGIVKFRPASEIGGGQPFVPSLEQVTDVDNVTRNFIDVRNQSGTERSAYYAGRAEFYNYSEINNAILSRAEISTRDNGASILVNSYNSLLTVNAATRPEIFGSDGNLENILDFGLPENVGVGGTATRFYFPETPYESGGQVLATQSYVDDAVANSVGGGGSAQSLQQTLENGNVTSLPIYIETGDNFVLELGKPYTSDQYQFNFSDRGNNTDFEDTRDIQVSANIEEGFYVASGDTTQSRSFFSIGGGNMQYQNSNNTDNIQTVFDISALGIMSFEGNRADFNSDLRIKNQKSLQFETAGGLDGFKFSNDGDPDAFSIFGPASSDNGKFFQLGEGIFKIFTVTSNPTEKTLLSYKFPMYSSLTERSSQTFYLPSIPTTQNEQQMLASWQQVYSITNITGTSTANDLSSTYVFSGTTASTLNLPTTGITPGRIFYSINNASANLVLDPAGSATISGNATRTVVPGKAIQVIFDGTNYRIISEF